MILTMSRSPACLVAVLAHAALVLVALLGAHPHAWDPSPGRLPCLACTGLAALSLGIVMPAAAFLALDDRSPRRTVTRHA